MISSRALGVTVLVLVIATSAVQGQTVARYREFQLGGDIASIAALVGMSPSDAKTLHERPAVLQELQWQRPYVLRGATPADPVQRIAFSFYNDQLFRMVVDYDRDRTVGMTDADMIEAMSTMYGTPVTPKVRPTRTLPASDEESGDRVAGWGNTDYTVVLYSYSYTPGFKMVVTSVPLNELARTAQA